MVMSNLECPDQFRRIWGLDLSRIQEAKFDRIWSLKFCEIQLTEL